MDFSFENTKEVLQKEFRGNKFSNLPLETITPSIVPNKIADISLLAIVFEGKVAAYRFRTNVGCFDITRAKAMEYGVSGFKVEKAVQLQRYNGMLVTQSEINNRRCVPDVSECVEDCEKLFKALFGESKDSDTLGNYKLKENVSGKVFTNQDMGIAYVIDILFANIMNNGAFWGFFDTQYIQRYMKDIEAEPNISVHEIGNTCLVEAQPAFLLNSIQKESPDAITQGDVNKIQQAMAEGLIGFEKFLIHYGKQIEDGEAFRNLVGIYSTIDTENVVVKGMNYPVFNVSMGDALKLLAHYCYEININGWFMSVLEALKTRDAIWKSITVSPIKQCIFIDVRSTLSAEQIYEKEMEFKKRYGLE